MKVWPIDPLDSQSMRLEVPEKLPQGLVETLFKQVKQRSMESLFRFFQDGEHQHPALVALGRVRFVVSRK
jgi:hypothetical protein